MSTSLPQIVEAVIFAAESPVSLAFLLELLNTADTAAENGQESPAAASEPEAKVNEDELQAALVALQAKYADAAFAFELRQVAEGYQVGRDLHISHNGNMIQLVE